MNETQVEDPLVTLVDNLLNEEDPRQYLYYFLAQVMTSNSNLLADKDKIIDNLQEELAALQVKHKELSKEYGVLLYGSYKESKDENIQD